MRRIAAITLATLALASNASASLVSADALERWLKTQFYVWNHEPVDIIRADCRKLDNVSSLFSCDLGLRDTFNYPSFDFNVNDVLVMVVDNYPIAVVYCTELPPCR